MVKEGKKGNNRICKYGIMLSAANKSKGVRGRRGSAEKATHRIPPRSGCCPWCHWPRSRPTAGAAPNFWRCSCCFCCCCCCCYCWWSCGRRCLGWRGAGERRTTAESWPACPMPETDSEKKIKVLLRACEYSRNWVSKANICVEKLNYHLLCFKWPQKVLVVFGEENNIGG